MGIVNTVDFLNSTAKVQAEQAKNRTGGADLDQNAFLQLLMAQMKNQDPLNPTDSGEFLSQQAQFTQISELQQLNRTMSSSNEMMQASSLIGKDVQMEDPDNPLNLLSGVVSEAKINLTGASIVVDGVSYPLSSVISIKEASTES